MSRPPKSTSQRAPARHSRREFIQTEALVVELRSVGGRAVSGRSRNLSVTGIFVETTEQIEAGAEVQLFIGSPAGAAALRVLAQVVHIDPGVGFGARFLDEDEEAHAAVASFLQRVQKKP